MEKRRRNSATGVAVAEPESPRASLPTETELDRAISRDSRNVQVTYGAGVQALPLAGLRVSDARHIARDILNVDPQAPVLVNGRQVDASYRIAAGDQIEFVHAAGEKGALE
jgi:hypothetical protein